jgi:hypothetical protein
LNTKKIKKVLLGNPKFLNFNNSFIHLSPNPASDETSINIDLPDASLTDMEISVVNIAGVEIIRQKDIQKISNKKYKLNISNLSNGIYYLTIRNNYKTYIEPIVVIR